MDNPQLVAFQELEAIYTRNDELFIVVATDSEDLFEDPALAVVGEITEKAWTLPFATRVDSITNFQRLRADGDDVFVEDLVDVDQAHSRQELEALKETALREPRY